MNNMRKRIMSLALSGVLLMGNVPVQAWATGGGQEPGATQPIMLLNSGTETDAEEKYIEIDGVKLSEDSSMLSLVDGMLTLTLDSESETTPVKSINIKGQPVVIKLVGANEIDAGNVAAITTDRDLTITGAGSLKITTSNTVALEVKAAEVPETPAENEDGEKDKNVLTIDGAQVSVEVNYTAAPATDGDTIPEEPVGISCADGVVIQGAAHFKTNYSEEGTEYTLSEGYVKIADGDFAEAESPWAATGEALEFVGAGHLKYTNTDTEHTLGCGDECKLDKVKVLEEEHSEGNEGDREAGCGKKANCSKCGEYGTEELAHLSTDTEFVEVNEEKHKEVYVCCGADKDDTTQPHVPAYEMNGATVTAKCTVCGAEGSVTISADGGEVAGNTVYGATVECTGILSVGELSSIQYINHADEEKKPTENAPSAIGTYTATVTVADGVKAEKTFSITKIDFSKAEITLKENNFVYTGEEHKPEIESITLNGVTMDLAATTVSYSNNVNATSETSKATVTVSMPADSNYMNYAVKEFTIEAIAITENDVKLGQALTYNGQEQEQTVVPAVENSGVTFEVTGNKQTNAGENYELTVTGTGNYKDSVKLTYSIDKTEYYTDATKTAQISGLNVGDLEQTKFTGVKIGDSVETVEGTCKYTFTYKDSTTEAVWSAIQNRVNDEMKAGDKAVIQYTFTPAGDGNYTGTKSGEIEVTKVDLTFEFDDGTKANADNVKKTGTITYGDTDAIKTAELTAKVNGSGEKGKGFTVKYAKVVDGTPEETKTDAFSAGSNRFWITYSGTIGSYSFENVPVCDGWLSDVARKPLAEGDLVPPRAVYISEKADGSPVELLTPAKKGYVNNGKDGESLEYGLMTKDGWVDWSWKTKVPTATEEGCYDVYYRPSDNYTPRTEGYVRVLVVPYLTATYGDKFNEITLPAGFTFNKTEHPDLTKTVGDAGEQNVYLDYTHPNDDPDVQNDYPTLTGYKVKMKVDPKEVTAIYSVLNADVYDKNGDDWVAFASTTKDDLFIVKADGQKLVPGTDYTVEKTASTDGLEVQHNFKCKDGGNYKFEPFSSERVYVYRAKHAKLESDNFPEEILKGTEYDTLDKAKKALKEEVKGEDTKCPDEYMKFFKIYLMKQSGARLADNQWVEHMEEGMFPPAGLTYEIPYADLDNATEKDAFRVAVLYLAGENEGKIIQLYKENGEFELTDTGLQINDLDREALVCVAREVDLTKEYTITKSITLDSKTSTQGTLTVKVDDKVVTKTTYGKTVVVTASAKSGYSVVGVAVTDASGNKVETKQSGSTYEFKMPASNVTVKLSLKKTTSSSKNPSSGDSSNIGLWIAVLAFSGISVLALLIVWLRKRKK